jgi:hypothetical protein
MPEKCGHSLQRCIAIVHVSAAGMAQQVRVPLRRIQASRFRHSFHYAADGAHVQPLGRSARADTEQQRGGFDFQLFEQLGSNRKLGLDCCLSIFTDNDESLFSSFAPYHHAVFVSEVVHIDAHKFSSSQATAIEQLEDDAVPPWAGSRNLPFEQLLYLAFVRNIGQLVPLAWPGDGFDQAGLEQSFGLQPLAEALHGSQLSLDGGPLGAAFMQPNHNAADQLAIDLADGGLASARKG